MTSSDKSCTCHPELYRHQCTYPIFFQWSPESWLRARFEACRWGQCTIHLQARGVWAQTPVKVCSMQQKPEASLSRTLTVSEVWDQERVCWSSTHIFQKIPRHWGENESCVFFTWCSKPCQSESATSGPSRTTSEGHPQVFPGAGEAGVPKGLSISQDWAVRSAMTPAWHLPQSRWRQTLCSKNKISYINNLNGLILNHMLWLETYSGMKQ